MTNKNLNHKTRGSWMLSQSGRAGELGGLVRALGSLSLHPVMNGLE